MSEGSAGSVQKTSLSSIENITAHILIFQGEIAKVLASTSVFDTFQASSPVVHGLIDSVRAFNDTKGDFKTTDAKIAVVPFTKALANVLDRICQQILHVLLPCAEVIKEASAPFSDSVNEKMRIVNFISGRICRFSSLFASSSPGLDIMSSPRSSQAIGACVTLGKPAGFPQPTAALPASGALRQMATSPVRDKKKGVSLAHSINSRTAQQTIASFQKAFKPYEEDATIAKSERGPASSHGVVLTAGYTVEIGSEGLVSPPRPIMISDPAHFDQEYTRFFFGYDHWNFVGSDPRLGPCVLSMIINKRVHIPAKSVENIILRCFIRTKAGEKLLSCSTETRKKDGEFGSAEALRAFKKQYVEYSTIPLELVERGDLELNLCDYEEKFHTTKFKFGILFATGNQGGVEDEMYGNENGDMLFDEFLGLLGTKVCLRGWNKFRGGLDTSGDATGLYSIYTDWRGFEIMFHVSTLLPFSSVNPQQVERKRHLGNDIVVLVFHTGKGEFNPSCFRSHFNHVFIIVRPVTSSSGEVHYTVTCLLRGDVQLFPPQFPRDYQFNQDEFFREFILSKLMNAELASLKSAQFAQRLAGVRRDMLTEIVDKMKPK